jgi:hypothetical protein
MRPSFRVLFLISAASVVLHVSLLSALIILAGYIASDRLDLWLSKRKRKRAIDKVIMGGRHAKMLPTLKGQVSPDKAVAKEYYAAEATSYKEILNPDVELVPNEQLLAQNGIKMLEHHRIKLRSPATGRQVDAIATTSKELSTGATISSIYAVDGHNMVSVTARVYDDPGRAALFLNSLTILC